MKQKTFNPESLFLPTKQYLVHADEREMIIDELIPGASLTMIAAPPGAGKTRLALAITRAISTGSDFLGFFSNEGKILYLNLDMMHQADIKDRFLELTNEGDELPDWVDQIYWMEQEFNLNGPILDDNGQAIPDPNNPSSVYMWRQFLVDFINKHEFKLVVIDTFHKLMVNSGLDHTDNDDADKVLLPLKDIARKTKTGFLLLHHTPLDDSKRPRGASAIAATVDHLLYTTGSIRGKLEIGISKTRLSLTGKFPITINEEWSWHPSESDHESKPMGAWIGIISQKEHHLTKMEQTELINHRKFAEYMAIAGERIDDNTRCQGAAILQTDAAPADRAKDQGQRQPTLHFQNSRHFRGLRLWVVLRHVYIPQPTVYYIWRHKPTPKNSPAHTATTTEPRNTLSMLMEC